MSRIAVVIMLIFTVLLSYGQKHDDSRYTELGYSTEIQSKILDESKKLFIHLPFDFDANKEYPLIVLSDLMAFKPLSAITEIMAYNKTIPFCIVVCPVPTSPKNDYSPVVNDTAPGSNGGKTINFYEQELLPYLDSNFNVSKKILWGQRFSGMFATFVMLTKPSIFDAYLADLPKLDVLEKEIITENIFENIGTDEVFYQVSWTSLTAKPKAMDILLEKLETGAPDNLRWRYSEESDSVMITHILTNYTYGLNSFFNEK